MPNIYVTDETNTLLEKVHKKDKRTKDGEINYLCSERAKELGILATKEITPIETPTPKDNDTDSSAQSQ